MSALDRAWIFLKYDETRPFASSTQSKRIAEAESVDDLTAYEQKLKEKDIRCEKCGRYFMSERGKVEHNCLGKPVDYQQPLSHDETKELKDFLNMFSSGEQPEEEKCFLCNGLGTLPDGDLCPICG